MPAISRRARRSAERTQLGRYSVQVEQTNFELEATRACVTDSHTGRAVFRTSGSCAEDTCVHYASEWNQGNPQEFLRWMELGRSLIGMLVNEHALPWHFASNPLGGFNIISSDNHVIMCAESDELALWVVKLAAQLG
jgi:hypothetical protein